MSLSIPSCLGHQGIKTITHHDTETLSRSILKKQTPNYTERSRDPAERSTLVGLVQPREEKAPRRPWISFQCIKGPTINLERNALQGRGVTGQG